MNMATVVASSSLFFSPRRTIRFALGFCIGAAIGMLCVQFAMVHIAVQMRTVEKGSLQYFFDTGGGFNETQSRLIPLAESFIFSSYTGSIPANGLRAIRVDPIETVGKFEIRGLKIDYLFWQRQWNGKEELKYLVPMNDIEVKSPDEKILAAQSIGSDPSFIIRELEYVQQWQLIATFYSALIGGVVGLLLLAVARYFGGGKSVLVYKHTSLIIIVVAAALFRIIYWWNSGLPSDPSKMGGIHPDEGTYFYIARYIMTHGLWDYMLSEKSVMAAPGNPIYIAMMYTFTNSVVAIRAVNFFISILTIVLIYKLGKRTFSKSVGLLAAGICAIHWQLIEYSVTLLTEPLFLCTFIAGIYFLVRTLDKPVSPSFGYLCYALVTTVFMTIAILTRSIAMLLPMALLAAIGMLDAYRSRCEGGKLSFLRLKRAALPLILPMLAVGIVATKNHLIFDRFMVATGSGAALWLGSRADTEGDEPPYRGLTYDTKVITQGASHLSVQGDMLLMAAARKNILENPLNYAWWNVKKIGRLLVGSNLVWFYPYMNIEEWYRETGQDTFAAVNLIFRIVLTTSIAVYGLIGLVLARGHGLFGFISIISASYLVIFSIPFLVNQRYGLPLVMLLVIPASAVTYGAWHATGRYRKAVLIAVPIIFGIVLQVFLGGN